MQPRRAGRAGGAGTGSGGGGLPSADMGAYCRRQSHKQVHRNYVTRPMKRPEPAVPAAVYSRREALRYLSASTLLALGLWPGRLRADNEQPAGSFRFHVINDTHCVSPECGPYLAGVVAQMKRDETAFCLHLGDISDKGDREHIEDVREIFKPLPGPMYPVIGNHDYLSQNDRSAYTAAYPTRINYHFSHGGWQFVGLDTTEGLHYEKTSVPSE